MTNSVDSDQTLGVRSSSTLFALACLLDTQDEDLSKITTL